MVPLGQREKRFLHVRKLRGSGFSSGQHGYRLTAQGLRLFPRLADIPADGGYLLDGHRITTGIPGLDAMLGGGLWPGSATMVAGPSGVGKTVMGLRFIYGGAEHGERGIIATLQENPTQLTRLLGGLGWPPPGPAVEVMYRSPVDIYIDEWAHDLLEAVERTGARRILIDSLMDLQNAAIEETRFREFMYSLIQRFSRQGISVLTTYETPGLHSTSKLSEFAISHLADNLITLTYRPGHDAMERSLAVIKARASRHDSAIRPFTVSPDGISLSDPPSQGSHRSPATMPERQDQDKADR